MVFDSLRRSAICFCVLRWCPDEWEQGMDVDIVVDHARLNEALSIIERVAGESSGVIINVNSYGVRRHVIVGLPDNDDGRSRFIEFDLQTYVVEGDLLLVSAAEILSDLRLEDGVPVPALRLDAALLIFRSILRRKDFKESWWRVVQQAALDAPCDLRSVLSGLIGVEMAERVVSLTKSANKPALLALREDLVHARLLSAPASAFPEGGALAGRLLKRVRWLLRPPGTLVCFVGPDGAGKTTIAKQVARALQRAPYPVRYLYCGKGGVAGGPEVSSGPLKLGAALIDLAKKLIKPRSGVMKTLWTTCALLRCLPRELWLYVRDIRPVLARNGIVLADRYYFDLFANVWQELPDWLATGLLQRMPRPDLTVHLVNRPEIVFSRKAERSIEEIEKCMKRLRAVGSRMPNWREIPTDEPVEQVAWSVIRDVMALRHS